MKKMIKYILVLSAGLLLLGSCTKNFEEIHDYGYGLTEDDFTRDNRIVGAGFQTIMKDVYRSRAGWDYQTYQNLNADVFSGYMASPNFPNGQHNFELNNTWNDTCWNDGYAVMSDWMSNLKICMKYGFPEMGVIASSTEALALDWKESVYRHYIAVNTVCKVLGMSRIADQYGPIIYSAYGATDGTGGKYDSLQDVYALMLDELAEAVEMLDWAVNNPAADFSRFDIIYGGDMAKWARLANSLRMRLAMRMVKADPTTAKAEFEAAVAAPQGPMIKGDNYTLVNNNWFNSLWTCSTSYGDIFMGADIVSIMSGYNDPRLPLYGLPIDGEVIGIRTGLPDTASRAGGVSRKIQYVPDVDNRISLVSYLNIPNTDFRTILVYAAETQFLLAEAALRGWNVGGGTAQSYYEQGVADAFADWGVGVGSYLTSNGTAAPYEDVLYDDFDIDGMSDVTPNWADASSDEERLEKIITQKWIAMFPEGMNAWAEQRRTGYPKLFPIVENKVPSVIPTELGVRRLTYTATQVSSNKANVEEAVRMLGGPDTGATRLFWDMNKGNF